MRFGAHDAAWAALARILGVVVGDPLLGGGESGRTEVAADGEPTEAAVLVAGIPVSEPSVGNPGRAMAVGACRADRRYPFAAVS